MLVDAELGEREGLNDSDRLHGAQDWFLRDELPQFADVFRGVVQLDLVAIYAAQYILVRGGHVLAISGVKGDALRNIGDLAPIVERIFRSFVLLINSAVSILMRERVKEQAPWSSPLLSTAQFAVHAM